ncbi:RNA-directed DNA polymerase from mobile element jockey-like [Elysia marginata]|uniref:RNA-directed DNA polymerase from mobile element jockey-like n=1 Tax=Elysia marginata TaxID=1093978 RepID=A0AAV4GI08_9GAST|nr:RNA-directed DNA polymerase from mobile element jockey-like [Elysia marginata]
MISGGVGPGEVCSSLGAGLDLYPCAVPVLFYLSRIIFRVCGVSKPMHDGNVMIPSNSFNIYLIDMPETNSLQLGYVDDWVLTHQSKEWTEIEDTLGKDTTGLNEYFESWYLKMNTTKSVSTAFHLNNHEA